MKADETLDRHHHHHHHRRHQPHLGTVAGAQSQLEEPAAATHAQHARA